MWYTKEVDLGIVRAKEKFRVDFIFTDKITENFKFALSCGCMDYQWTPETGKLAVYIKFKPVPYNLQQQGYYNAEKKIKAMHGTTEDILIIKAKVI